MKLTNKLTITLALLFINIATSLAATQSIGVIVIKSDGTTHELELEAIDRMEIGTQAVEIHHTSGTSSTHNITDIDRINIGVAVAGIDRVLADTGDIAVWPTTTTGNVYIKGAAAGTPIAVYTLSGQCVANAHTSSDGATTINIATLAPGVYVVAVGSHSVKITKK